MCLPEDMLQEKCVLDDMNQTGSSNIMLVWNSCWPDGVLMGTFICFFITTKMSYILTPLLPLFPKGCQHKNHYNMTAGGNFFFFSTHYFFKWFCKERKDLGIKIAGKRTVQQRSFSKCLSVSSAAAFGVHAAWGRRMQSATGMSWARTVPGEQPGWFHVVLPEGELPCGWHTLLLYCPAFPDYARAQTV